MHKGRPGATRTTYRLTRASASLGGSASVSQEQDISQKVTLSWAAMWPAGVVRCSSAGVTVADGGHRNSHEVFLLLQLRRRVGGELWQPFVVAIVRASRGTRRHPPDTEPAAKG